MKTVLRNTSNPKTIMLVAILVLAQLANAQTYTTRANGNWNSLATWAGGLVPPSTILVTMTVNINHAVTYNLGSDFSNYGTIRISNTTGTTPVFTMPSGRNVENRRTGKFYIKDSEYRNYRYVGGGNSGTSQSGAFSNLGGLLDINNSIVEVAGKWSSDDGGKRIFRKGVLLIGEEYEMKNSNCIDTLDKVSLSAGWHGGKDMTISNGSIYFNQAKIQLVGSSKFKVDAGKASGDIDYITFKNHVTGVTDAGDLEVKSGVIIQGSLNLDAYCMGDVSKYKPNGKVSGTQSADCNLNYFPSAFLIQQTALLSAGLGFSNPLPIGTASLAVGAKYKFASVNDTTDAIVTIDSLINGATVQSIDDNTPGTGYGFAFQPRVTSGNIVGKSYAVFTISFVKKGTNTPISLQYINATPLDIDGGATLKEFAEVTMGSGSAMKYMSSSLDISILPLAAGSYGAQNVLGIERNNIDTSSYNNMFTVSNTDMSSFRIKYGTYTSSPSTATRQFSLYMKGFAYQYFTLPVKMSSFTAALVTPKKAELKWSTASEINLNNFIVERSTDGVNYSDAGVVFAYGNTTSNSDYNFFDDVAGIQSNVIYYRLRSVDVDGKTANSEIRVINLKSATNNISILAYPNPAINEVRVTIPASWQQKAVVYELYAANGQIAKRTSTANSSQTETIDLTNVPSGLFILKVTCGTESTQQKIVKH